MAVVEPTPTVFVGHPFAPIGKGEELRANLRALQYLDEPVQVLDVYGVAEKSDPDHLSLIESIETHRLTAQGNRIFHINGDEIDPVLRHLDARGSRISRGRNIVVPAWELPEFPSVWVEQVKRFDEVWAISHFVRDALAKSGVESYYIGQSVDVPIRPFLSRKHFGIRESAFVFLTFFDFSSYSARKNPWAVIEMFRRILADRPFDDIQLVLKVKGESSGAAQRFAESVDLPRDAFVVVNRVLNTFEQHSLLANCDCLASLHRSEGFGRGMGEAMRLGRLALATGWSGNMDFMDDENSLLVKYELVPVEPGAYPESDGQVWAEPDVEHAAYLARWAIDQTADARRMSQRGCDDIVRRMCNRAVGLRMLERLKAAEKVRVAPPPIGAELVAPK